ncbi:Riboflavin biosynthesis protein RibBA, variant 2 [Balamuthia mandrillaris]
MSTLRTRPSPSCSPMLLSSSVMTLVFSLLCKHRTGVSATDRSLTIMRMAVEEATAEEFSRPGHIFPLVARPGGVLERRGHTEASMDLCKYAGMAPVGLLSEIAKDDGTMARLDDCVEFARQHGLLLVTIEDLVAWRLAHGHLPPSSSDVVEETEQQCKVKMLSQCIIPLEREGQFLGNWLMRCYQSHDGECHVALIKLEKTVTSTADKALEDELAKLSERSRSEPILTRVHSECFTGDVLGSRRCDCGDQLSNALLQIHLRGYGIVIYVVGHEGRGIGLVNKIKAYDQMQRSKDTIDTYAANELLGFPADMRSYEEPLSILKDLKIEAVELLTNNAQKYEALAQGNKLRVVMSPLLLAPNEHNVAYLRAKRKKEKEMLSSSPLLRHAVVKSTADESSSSSINNEEKNESSAMLGSQEIPLLLPSSSSVARLRIGIIRTRWNELLVDSLYQKCKDELFHANVNLANIIESQVPGAFELPFAAQRLARSGLVDAVICFGVLIKGETTHFEYISQAVSQGLMNAQLATDVPVLYGVLHCSTKEQAQERCNEKSSLPISLALTAIHMAALKAEALPLFAAPAEGKGSHGQLSSHSLSSVLSRPVIPPCHHA